MFILTGCFKSEELDKADIYTTTYPIEFIVKELYGYNSDCYNRFYSSCS